MEKLICNKNLALSAKAPPFEQSKQRVLGADGGGRRSQEQALPLPLLDGGWAENSPDRLIKHCLEAPLRERRALQVFDGTDLLGHGQALRVGDGRQLLLLQLLDRVFIVPQVKFRPHQDDGCVGTMVSHFRVPLCTNIFK